VTLSVSVSVFVSVSVVCHLAGQTNWQNAVGVNQPRVAGVAGVKLNCKFLRWLIGNGLFGMPLL